MSSMCFTDGRLNRNTCSVRCKDDSNILGESGVTPTCKCTLGDCRWMHKTGKLKNQPVNFDHLECPEPQVAPAMRMTK